MVRVGVVGCAHGQFDAIYRHIEQHNLSSSSSSSSSSSGHAIDLLLCCGDVQCLRNTSDLACEACPRKYRHMNEFHKYYSGAKRAPVLTIMVGGNHEASNYLQELHYGGWIAPNMFFLGAAGVVNVLGLRIAGISGIYDAQDYHKGHFERVPYSKKSLYSAVHTRQMQVFQLSHLTGALDVMLSHDWPRKIQEYGDLDALLRRRPDFRASIQADAFGSVAGEILLHKLKPAHWLAGHMHVRFDATVPHTATTTTTKFLALDKCQSTRPWFEVLDITPSMGTGATATSRRANGDVRVKMDVEWLAILRATHHVLSRNPNDLIMPRELLPVRDNDLEWVRKRLQTAAYQSTSTIGDHVLVEGEWMHDFVMTAPSHGQEDEMWTDGPLGNPQTDALLELLQLRHVVTSPYCPEHGDSDSDGDESDTDSAAVSRSTANDDFLESLESTGIAFTNFQF